MSTATITQTALRLPIQERAALLLSLFDSLPADAAESDDILAEAIRRDAEMESGLVREISHEEFLAGLRIPQVA